MLKLIRITDDSFIVHSHSRAIHGNRARTIRTLLMLDVLESEIEFGMGQLIDLNHHLAEYGVNKTLIFTRSLVA